MNPKPGKPASFRRLSLKSQDWAQQFHGGRISAAAPRWTPHVARGRRESPPVKGRPRLGEKEGSGGGGAQPSAKARLANCKGGKRRRGRRGGGGGFKMKEGGGLLQKAPGAPKGSRRRIVWREREREERERRRAQPGRSLRGADREEEESAPRPPRGEGEAGLSEAGARGGEARRREGRSAGSAYPDRPSRAGSPTPGTGGWAAPAPVTRLPGARRSPAPLRPPARLAAAAAAAAGDHLRQRGLRAPAGRKDGGRGREREIPPPRRRLGRGGGVQQPGSLPPTHVSTLSAPSPPKIVEKTGRERE